MTRKRKSPTPQEVEKENSIIELRKSGETWQRIAQVVGYANASGAQKAYMRAVKRVQREPIEAIFDMELERLDRIQRAYWKPAIVDLNSKAADIVLKVMDRRAKLLGLEAPQRVDVSAEVITYDGSIIEQQANAIIELVRNNRNQTSIMGSGVSQTGTDT